MSVEEQLRRTLADERHAMPAWPDPVDRVRTGVERRIRRRRAAVAVSLVILAAVVAGVPSILRWTSEAAPIAPADHEEVVPWREAPLPPPTGLARRNPLADARDCAASDLNPAAWVEPDAAVAGNQAYTVLLPNKSDSRCTLRGSAQIVATDAGTGRRVAVAAKPTSVTDDASHYPATVDPGEPARIDIVALGRCSDQSDTPRRYRDLAVVVLGTEYPISELQLTTACPLGVGNWRVLPSLLNVPYVVASIDAPDEVRRGQTLEYVVTLLNSGNQTYHLDPCPAFTQQFAGVSATHRLNCVVSKIGPHASARFQMRFSVPDDATPGRTSLTWRAVAADGKVVIANLAEGTYINITE